MNKPFLVKFLPLILLGGLLLTGLVTIFTQSGQYGITVDEPIQDSYGHAVMEWYYTLGRDTSFLTAFPADTYMPEHGGIFDAGIAAVQHAFSPADHWHVRRVITALAGLLGLVAIALCGYEMGGYWMAFLAALMLWLYPRYYGAIYNNPKDIPATVTTTLVLWGALLLLKQWGQEKRYLRNSLLVGFFIGLAASIRVTAVIWYAIFVLVVLGWWFLRGREVRREHRVRAELSKQGISALVIGLSSWLTMIILWPYVFLNPVVNLLRSIKVLSKYPWDGSVLYNGALVAATKLPRTYSLEWLVIGSPPTLVLFALLGLGIAGVVCVRKRLIDPQVAVVILSLLVPLGAMIGLHSVLYNALRQFLFLIPSMILLAVYGLVQMVQYLRGRKQRVLRLAAVGLAVLTLASYVQVINDMANLSPFEYTYFSPFVGGLAGAARNFETDYWATCSEQAAIWLAQNYQHYTNSSTPSVEAGANQDQISPFLAPKFHRDSVNSDFYIVPIGVPIDPKYKTIHTIGMRGAIFCLIKVNSTITHHEELPGKNVVITGKPATGIPDVKMLQQAFIGSK